MTRAQPTADGSGFAVLAGSASQRLGHAIAAELGRPLGAVATERFPDGELGLRIDEPLGGRPVFIVQSTGPPVHDHLVELLAFADACRRAGSGRVTAVVPYFGYARAELRRARGEPILASLVAELIQTAGVHRLVTIDVHAPAIEGFFRIPVENLTAVPLLAEAAADAIPEDAVVVSPDLGAVERATRFAAHWRLPVSILHKLRASGTEVEIARVIGDVRGRTCIIVDDMISTGGTIVEAMRALVRAGARDEFYVVATHAVLAARARERLAAPRVRAVLLTDTLPIERRAHERIRTVSVAPLLARAIRRLAAEPAPRDPS